MVPATADKLAEKALQLNPNYPYSALDVGLIEEGSSRWLNDSSFSGLTHLDLAFELDGAAP